AGAESWFGGGARAVQDALEQSGMARSDLHVADLYDPFSIVTLVLLDEYRLTGDVPAGAFVRDGHTGPGGTLPTHTGCGQLSGFYLQGMTPLAEAIIQLRGTGGQRQVPGATVALIGGIGGRMDHHAGVVLGRAARPAPRSRTDCWTARWRPTPMTTWWRRCTGRPHATSSRCRSARRALWRSSSTRK